MLKKYVVITTLFSIILIFSNLNTIGNEEKIQENFEKILFVGGNGPGNYSKIQTAIDDANPGDTVYVFDGTYFENYILIDKKINLIGENKFSTIIDAQCNYKCLQIYQDEISVSGFTFKNISSVYDIWFNSLLEINQSENVTIENNIFFNKSVNLPTLQISGICILDSMNCNFKNNSMYNCSIAMWGLQNRGQISNYIHDIDSNNTVNKKPFYYYKNKQNLDIELDAGQVYLVNCSYCNISNLDIRNASYTIHICHSDHNIIEKNNLDNNVIGIMFDHSNYNIIRNNTITDIFCGGIFFDFSDYNLIEHNDIHVNMGALAFEMNSDNNEIKNNNIKAKGTSMLFDNSDHNNIICNNIYGSFLIPYFNEYGTAAMTWGKSRNNRWNNNYWDNRANINLPIIKKIPRGIIGMHKSLYDSFLKNPPTITIPSYIRFDWNPAIDPYNI